MALDIEECRSLGRFFQVLLIGLIPVFGMMVVLGTASPAAERASAPRDAVQMYPYGTRPTLRCAPNVMCEVVLHDDEQIIPDPNGAAVPPPGIDAWIVKIVQAAEPHILVSPLSLDSGTTTLTILTTARRSYHIKLETVPTSAQTVIGFSNPPPSQAPLTAGQQIALALATAAHFNTQGSPMTGADATGAVDPTHLDFRYSVKGDAPFRPVTVFNDGGRTYVRLPDGLPVIPVLRVYDVVGGRSEDRVVNFTYQDGYFIFAGLFPHFGLVSGTGKSRVEVRIDRS